MRAITQIALTQPETSRRRNRSLMTMMSSQNHRTNINTAKASARKLRKVKPSEKNNIAISLVYLADLLDPPDRRWSARPHALHSPCSECYWHLPKYSSHCE